MTPSIEDLLRAEAPQVLGALVRRFGHFDIAEDAVQEALLSAARSWPVDGVPDNPRSRLIRIAYRRMIDMLRADQARRRREIDAATRAEPLRTAHHSDVDDSLTLLLLCCHPALGMAAQVALTLRAVGGLTTAEIAHAYGTTEATMGTRISRAKQQLAKAGARFTPPTDADRDQRLAAVLHALYLIFNEGYTATTGGELVRVDLTAEAVRVTRMLHDTAPGDAEVTGLLALMLLTESRRAARTHAGELVPLDEQNPAHWNHSLIEEGTALIDSVWNHGPAGPYQIQAAIAALHAMGAPGETDWPQIALLYLWLERLTPTPPVQLARVVAVAHAYGPARGLALLDDLNRRHHLDRNPLTQQREHAVRAHLLQQTGDRATATRLFRRAADLTSNTVEQRYLRAKADHPD
ncbi:MULTISPECIES: RNA polymerase sigma factor [Nocardia]|uniref:RNA polymerase sigma factor n=1 Tax=Nocardia TaxID=1817 RepID=UPI0007A3A6D4|nr:sigma-70 family RNA polymerase sigma factor [Nocardia salmonicida]